MLKNSSQMPIGGVITEARSSLKYKTGSWRAFRPKVDYKKCISCMRCILNCPENCIAYKDAKLKVLVDLDYCKGCGVCAKHCPVKAITMDRE